MSKRSISKAGVYIGKLRLRGRVLRDLIHGGAGPVVIDQIDADADIGGDVIHTPAKRRKRKPKKKALTSSGRRVITHCALAAFSLVGSVAASGLAYALGWV